MLPRGSGHRDFLWKEVIQQNIDSLESKAHFYIRIHVKLALVKLNFFSKTNQQDLKRC